MIDQTKISISGHVWGVRAACAGVGGGGGLLWGRVWAGVHGCANMCGMNFQNFFQRMESLHQRTLIRILYKFFNKTMQKKGVKSIHEF